MIIITTVSYTGVNTLQVLHPEIPHFGILFVESYCYTYIDAVENLLYGVN